MKRNTTIAIFALCGAAALYGGPATSFNPGAKAVDVKINRLDSTLLVSMEFDATALNPASDREITYTPAIVAGDSVRRLPAVTVAGRNRYIQNRRHGIPGGEGALMIRGGRSIAYSASVAYADWMEESTLVLNSNECNCGLTIGKASGKQAATLATLDFAERTFQPHYIFVTPPAETTKMRAASGSAYIDFPVNRTEIHPDYRRNPQELASIRSTIDLVVNDSDTRITSLRIKGFASPEGKYKNNSRLASGRAASLAEYVRGLYSFDSELISIDSEPENWEGLRSYVAGSGMAETDGLLAIIDNVDLEPDAREVLLRRKYPEQYAFLLKEVYPGLRRSDYTIEYEVRSYVSVDEIKKVMATRPGNLSLNEIYVVANTLDSNSLEYREAFELAVRMFPDDPAANLNMAIIALQRNELDVVEGYLAKAGSGARADYARGIYQAKLGNADAAASHLERAAAAGVTEAADAMEQLRRMKAFKTTDTNTNK